MQGDTSSWTLITIWHPHGRNNNTKITLIRHKLIIDMNVLKKILLYVWQLPQNLLGMLMFWWYSRDTICVEGVFRRVRVLYTKRMRRAISLGEYVIAPYGYHPLSRTAADGRDTLVHEWGHTRQSLILGWLYLPLVGLQSLAHAILHRKACGNSHYRHFWTERWADRLAAKY